MLLLTPDLTVIAHLVVEAYVTRGIRVTKVLRICRIPLSVLSCTKRQKKNINKIYVAVITWKSMHRNPREIWLLQILFNKVLDLNENN